MNTDKLKKIFSHLCAGIMSGVGMKHLVGHPEHDFGFTAEEVEQVQKMTLAEVWEATRKPDAAV